MEFAILGSLEVRDQHRRIDVPSGKARQLLAVLVMLANEVVPTDRLIEALWDAAPPITAANTLQTYVSHLRKVLEPDRSPRAKDGVLRTHGHGYQLVVVPEAVDAVRFEMLARDGHHVLASDPARAAELLRAALGLWRGEPLAGFGGALFAQAEIARLTELRAAVLEDRIEADLALGRHAVLCSELSRAVVQQPLRERMWSQLIRALYRCGRYADAVAAYPRLREQLGRLGIEPSRELVQLHEAVLAQRPELDWTPPPPRSGGPSVLEGRLRAEDLQRLAEAAWWSGRYRESLAARQHAHDANLRAGAPRRAVVDATILAMHYAAFRQFAVANGWFQRALRLLSAEADCAEHGYLSLADAVVRLAVGDHEGCLVAARSTYDSGLRHGVAGLQALGMVFQGIALIHQEQIAEGLALHDEGMMMVASSSFSQLATMQIFCQVVNAGCELQEVSDQARLELLRGRPNEAAALIDAALTGEGGDPKLRGWLLCDRVAIALAIDDLDTARAEATELATLAQTYRSAALFAVAAAARSVLRLVTGEDALVPSWRRSATPWREVVPPDDNACVGALLATVEAPCLVLQR